MNDSPSIFRYILNEKLNNAYQGVIMRTKEKQAQPPKLLRVKAVSSLTTLAVSTIHLKARNKLDTFPKSKKLTPNTAVWLEEEVLHWIDNQLNGDYHE